MSTLGPGLAHPGRVPVVKVVVTETLDATTVPRLRDLLDEALALRPERLVVDVAGYPHIDPAAIAVLREAHRQATRTGGQLAVREPAGRTHQSPRLGRTADDPRVIRRATGTVPPSAWWTAVWTGAADADADVGRD